jgi:hypothetical protein
MWDTTNLNLFLTFGKKHVECGGIRHLAKNERDIGHPTLCGREKGRTLSLTVSETQALPAGIGGPAAVDHQGMPIHKPALLRIGQKKNGLGDIVR